MMIDRVGSVEKIDWIRIFNRTAQFITNNESILTYVANKILKGDIYKHFVNRYNLRVDGIKFTNGNDTYNGKNVVRRMIVLKWEIGGLNKEKEINLGSLAQDKRDWWRSMTNRSNKNRYKIVDYDKLLNKRDENEVLPYRCPIDNNIILNYTGIDFSGGNHNMYECKNNTGLNETWSMSSIDRIDSKREYDYDNIQIISQYYNSLKNCGSFEQIDKLYNYYQFKIKNELYPIEYMI